MLKVAKFGGSSVANGKQISKIKQIIKEDPSIQIVVTSAVGKDNTNTSKITDLLFLLYAHLQYGVDYESILETIQQRFISIQSKLNLKYDISSEINKLRKELNKGISKDYLVSRGEYFTAKLLAEYLDYRFLDCADFICLNYDGSINYDLTKEALERHYKQGDLIVVPGFYAITPNKKVRLFERGGSDITGSILAKVANADLYENWTDVDGIFVADPSIVASPKLIENITYKELRELSYRGANILHEETIVPLATLDIPINIKNTNNPKCVGTLISNSFDKTSKLVTGISGQTNFTSFNITKNSSFHLISVLKDVLDLFLRFKINIEHIPTGIDTFSVIVKTEDMKDFYFDIIEEIRKIEGVLDLSLEDDIALIAVVGRNMSNIPGVAGKIFTILGNHDINIKIIAQASTELSIIIGISNKDYELTINEIYHKFIMVYE